MNWRSTTTAFRVKVFTIFLLICIAISSFVYTQYLIVKITNNERSSIELWAKALQYTSQEQNVAVRDQLDVLSSEILSNSLISYDTKMRWNTILDRANSELSNAGVDFVANELIINNRFEIPSIVVDSEGNIIQNVNVSDENLNPETISSFASMNSPITINLANEDVQYIYYGYSAIVRTLQFFPYVQFGLLALFLGLGYASLSGIRRNEQSRLWVGMARESAHQLGTPISSLMGWIALLKDSLKEESDLSIVHELDKDVERLVSIAERFNKIGSEPELKLVRMGPVLSEVTQYMKRRLPQLGESVGLISDIEMECRVNMNVELMKWAVENLIKNAMDANGINQTDHQVRVTSKHTSRGLIIDVEDNGKGIDKRYFNEIFSPGYSTKKRGWGLGLTLTKRIIEEYHEGSIFVLKSEPGVGTTFRIQLPVVKETQLTDAQLNI